MGKRLSDEDVERIAEALARKLPHTYVPYPYVVPRPTYPTPVYPVWWGQTVTTTPSTTWKVG